MYNDFIDDDFADDADDLTADERKFADNYIESELLDVEDFMYSKYDETHFIEELYDKVRWFYPQEKQKKYFDNCVNENIHIESSYMNYVSDVVQSILDSHEDELTLAQYIHIQALYEDIEYVCIDNPIKEPEYYFSDLKEEFLDDVDIYQKFTNFLLDKRFDYGLRFIESKEFDPFTGSPYPVYQPQILTSDPLQTLLEFFVNLCVCEVKLFPSEESFHFLLGDFSLLEDGSGFEFSNMFVEEAEGIQNDKYSIISWKNICDVFLCDEDLTKSTEDSVRYATRLPLLQKLCNESDLNMHAENAAHDMVFMKFISGENSLILYLTEKFGIKYNGERSAYIISNSPVDDFFKILLELYTKCSRVGFLSAACLLYKLRLEDIDGKQAIVFSSLTKDIASLAIS